jgi:hypothetical protein
MDEQLKPYHHGHMDEEANPSFESNITLHAHKDGDKPHYHWSAPSWGAVGKIYIKHPKPLGEYSWPGEQ